MADYLADGNSHHKGDARRQGYGDARRGGGHRGQGRAAGGASRRVGQAGSHDHEPRFMQEWSPSSLWDSSDLTAESKVHLLHRASSGIKDYSMKSYGGVCNVKHVWEKVPFTVRPFIENSCFGPLLQVALSIDKNNRPLVRGLLELFWDTTNTFHTPQFEMTVTPLDFAMLTGLPFGGLDLSYDRNFSSNIDVLAEMYGILAHKLSTKGATNVSYSVFSDVLDNEAMLTELDNDQLVRCFITYLLSATIFADRSNKTWFHYLTYLRDLNRLGEYDWGAAGYANLLQHLRRLCRVNNDVSTDANFSPVSVGGFWNILELWFYEYFPSCSPCSTRKTFPAAVRWALACRLPKQMSDRPRMKDVNYFRDFINGRPKDKDPLLPLLPWAESLWAELEIPPAVQAAQDLVKRRILFRGPFGYVWYLGERVLTVRDLRWIFRSFRNLFMGYHFLPTSKGLTGTIPRSCGVFCRHP